MGNQMQRDQSLVRRRPLHGRDRHMLDGPSGLLLRDQSVGRDGRRTCPAWHRLGRHTTGGGGGVNRSWDGIWNRASRAETRWGGPREIEIPLHTINFKPDAVELGRQLPAHDPAQDRRDALERVGAQPGADLYACGRTAAGTRRPSPGASVSISFRMSSATRRRRPGAAGLRPSKQVRSAATSSSNVTPGLRANLSINTDFAETESRSASGQPHAVSAVLPRETRVLPRRRQRVRVLTRDGQL